MLDFIQGDEKGIISMVLARLGLFCCWKIRFCQGGWKFLASKWAGVQEASLSSESVTPVSFAFEGVFSTAHSFAIELMCPCIIK